MVSYYAVWEPHHIEQAGGKDKFLNKRNEIIGKIMLMYIDTHSTIGDMVNGDVTSPCTLPMSSYKVYFSTN
uniref:Uncharacterized protein n=2 Tax=unclassified Prevotella TaxID=2638335 RepID=A0AB33J462_9BACT